MEVAITFLFFKLKTYNGRSLFRNTYLLRIHKKMYEINASFLIYFQKKKTRNFFLFKRVGITFPIFKIKNV